MVWLVSAKKIQSGWNEKKQDLSLTTLCHANEEKSFQFHFLFLFLFFFLLAHVDYYIFLQYLED